MLLNSFYSIKRAGGELNFCLQPVHFAPAENRVSSADLIELSKSSNGDLFEGVLFEGCSGSLLDNSDQLTLLIFNLGLTSCLIGA